MNETDKESISNMKPEPEFDSAAHGQEKSEIVNASSLDITRDTNGNLNRSLSENLYSLGNSDARRYGVQTLMQLAASWANDINTKVDSLTTSNSKLETKLEITENKLSEAREENVRLKAEAAINKKHKPHLTASVIVAPFLLALSLDEFKDGNWGLGIALLIAGLLLVLSMYFAYIKGDRND